MQKNQVKEARRRGSCRGQPGGRRRAGSVRDLGIVHEGCRARGVRQGGPDELFVGVREGGSLVNCVRSVGFKANLTSKGPGGFHTGVVGE